MNSQTIISKCEKLKLYKFATTYLEQQKQIASETLDFDTRLNELLDCQILANEDKRIALLTKQAKLRYSNGGLENIDYALFPKLKANVVNKLATCTWIEQNTHLLIIGPTGTGKTTLACGFGLAAIRKRIPVIFYRLANLLLELTAAKKEGEFTKLIRKINRAKLLILDDWGNALMNANERHLLFELIESRDLNGSLLITSQYPVATWHDAFNDSTIADSVLDRIVHKAHTVDLAQSPSIRKLVGMNGGQNEIK